MNSVSWCLQTILVPASLNKKKEEIQTESTEKMAKNYGWGDQLHMKTQINVYFQAVLSLMM